ncbi:hypothetical protein SAY87_027583 [Trapa incisa]|uniref:WRKY domain-containing protein n=1 Tax=Trapa incisa TaxID=236973 RepID=A0AAN7JMN2_9MYRT|nr:hypothetical protein SAY87_027583 [Trapa incisa]
MAAHNKSRAIESMICQDKQPQVSLDFNSHRRMIGQLADGRDLAVQLQTLLRNEPTQPRNYWSVAMAQDIVEKILKSFSDSICMLNAVESSDFSGSDDGGSKDSGAGKKRLDSSGSKNGRGCYKRSYAWRKYGQKEILNTKFPRCYYRCTHKYDQGCKATKQVQRMEDDQQLYRITYIGEHTCNRTSNLSPKMITDADPWELSDSLKPRNMNDNGHGHVAATVEKGYFKPEDARSDVTVKSLSLLRSKLEAELELGPEPTVAFEHDFSSLDDFMANFLHFDDEDFAFD